MLLHMDLTLASTCVCFVHSLCVPCISIMRDACCVLSATLACRQDDDLDQLMKRTVDIGTNTKFVTFYRPDLHAEPGAVDGVMKTWDHGSPGVTNAAYEVKDGRTALEDLCCLFVTASKEEAKKVLETVRERDDYAAFMHAARADWEVQATAHVEIQKEHLRQRGQHAEADALVPNVPPCDATFHASEAYAFMCVDISPESVQTCMMPPNDRTLHCIRELMTVVFTSVPVRVCACEPRQIGQAVFVSICELRSWCAGRPEKGPPRWQIWRISRLPRGETSMCTSESSIC